MSGFVNDGARYRWLPVLDRAVEVEALAASLGIPLLLAGCLLNRGVEDEEAARAFLEPRLRGLADPGRLPNLGRAVDRLLDARAAGEPVVVFGDYDVDGITATALLLEVLSALGWLATAYLPRRREEGYGLTCDAAAKCLDREPAPRLLLAVDCGSTAHDAVEWLGGQGVDVVVLDHHQVGSPPPCAVALVNPQLAPEGAGSHRELCSVGLAFKLAHALVKRGRGLGWQPAMDLDLRLVLDLVALGTIADLVPLRGENRILASCGLERLRTTTRVGLVALKEVAHVAGALGTHQVGFQLAPRLNAAGRLESASAALDLLMCRDPMRAGEIARLLEAQNRERQQIERGIADEVIGTLRAEFDPTRDFVIVEGQQPWHIGVVGIVASRVLTEFYRPTLIVGGDGAVWRGSGRSIEGFDLAAALRACDDLLVRHGGHAMAAGVTILPENLGPFRDRLNRLAREALHPEQLVPPLRLDASLALSDLDLDMVAALRRLEPHGVGNPPVQVLVRGLTLRGVPKRIGRDQQHVKLWVTDGCAVVETLWWGGGGKAIPQGRFDLACVPQVNEYGGQQRVQLRLLDWCLTDSRVGAE